MVLFHERKYPCMKKPEHELKYKQNQYHAYLKDRVEMTSLKSHVKTAQDIIHKKSYNIGLRPFAIYLFLYKVINSLLN